MQDSNNCRRWLSPPIAFGRPFRPNLGSLQTQACLEKRNRKMRSTPASSVARLRLYTSKRFHTKWCAVQPMETAAPPLCWDSGMSILAWKSEDSCSRAIVEPFQRMISQLQNYKTLQNKIEQVQNSHLPSWTFNLQASTSIFFCWGLIGFLEQSNCVHGTSEATFCLTCHAYWWKHMKTSIFVFRLGFARRKEATQALRLVLVSWLSLLPCKRSPKAWAHWGLKWFHDMLKQWKVRYVFSWFFSTEQFNNLALSPSINMLTHSCHGHAMAWDSWLSQQVVCMPDEPKPSQLHSRAPDMKYK